MSYVTLGYRGPLKGTPDTTALNKGNWTISFTPDIINVNQPQFEVYKMIVHGAPNTTFDVYVDNALWDTGIYGTQNSWDPVQPLILRPGQTLSFTYSDPVTDGLPPKCTIWMRYDTGTTSVLISGQQ